jgi:uncharacterized lipoprotein YbaY
MEINRRADFAGNVTLLVQDGRTGQLASIRVRLDGSQTSLRGQVVIRDRIQLPPDAMAIVSVENISRPFYAVRNGETSVYFNGQYSTPFEINYDPNYIDANDSYQVRARVTSGGRTILDTLQPIRVLGHNPSDNIQIVVVPVQSPNLVSASSPVISAGYGYGAVSDAMLAQHRQIYLRYLGRTPSDIEVAAFSVSPTPAADLESLPINLMAGQQYYDAVGNHQRISKNNWPSAHRSGRRTVVAIF